VGVRFAAVLVAIAAALCASVARGAPPTLESPTIIAGPLRWTQSQIADFEFDGNNDGVADLSFQCRLDGEGWAPCASPVQGLSVGEGQHTFDVRAITGPPPPDDTGRSKPAGWTWIVDVTPPSIPSDVTVEATSALGAVVAFTASDNLDESPVLACDPASGSVFAMGTWSVTCSASDKAGNQSAGDSFSVTVHDTTAPVIVPHGTVIAEQSSATGAVVAYSLPSSTDAVDSAPSLSCSPQSGLAFPLGTTTVTCVATDGSGNQSAPDQFDVIVQNGPLPPKPELSWNLKSSPTNRTSIQFTFSSEPGLTLECRLEGPGQSGVFAPCSSETSQGYSGLQDGGYRFTVRATNSIGNVNEATHPWSVDTVPPARVGAFRTRSGNGWVKLRWTKPVDSDYTHVVIRRKRAGTSDWTKVGVRRDVSSMVDWKARNDLLYTYSIRSVDRAKNRSLASTAHGRASKILKPQYNASVDAPVLIDWTTVRDATYFNMQVWRQGRKILSVWPLRSQFRLRSSWTYNGNRYVLGHDRYFVYVWPGYGSKVKANYGSLLGWSAFSVR
jgi:HYR domain